LGPVEGWSKDEARKLNPLIRWDSLLLETARRSGVESVWNPFLAQRPTLLWDEMVRALVAAEGGPDSQKAAAKTESILKQKVQQVLNEAETLAKGKICLNRLQSFWSAASGRAVTLNFDELLLAHQDTSAADAVPSEAPVTLHAAGHKLWYPHGCVREPASIHLGLRDYGFQPHAWNSLISNFKALEREALGTAARSKASGLPPFREAVAAGLVNPSADFIGHLLLAPLIFYGVGLSQDEWGWWWFLNQRARNLARVEERLRPFTVIIKHAKDLDAAFWTSCPAGVTPLFVEDWDTGWQVLMDYLDRG
jgi:hypothetical protein